MSCRQSAGSSTSKTRGRYGREPKARETIAERIERIEALDVVAEPLQQGVRAAIPQGTTLKDLLSGTVKGPETAPQPKLDVRTHDGMVEVKRNDT